MKILVLAVAVVMPNLSWAGQSVLPAELVAGVKALSVPVALSEQVTAFDTLKNLFDAGSAVEQKDVQGWWAGRRFGERAPNSPEAALLIGETGKANMGEMFTLPFRVMYYSNGTPSFYDSLNTNFAKAGDVFDAIAGDYPNTADPKFTKEGLASKTEYVGGSITLGVRKSGKYLIVKAVIFNLPKNKYVYYSYHYLKVNPD